MKTEEEICKSNYDSWNAQLKERFFELHNSCEYYIWDGVVSPYDYYKSKIKILFINREAYDVNSKSFDLVSEGLKEAIDYGKTFWDKQVTFRKSLSKEFAVIKAVIEKDSRDIETCINDYNNEDFITDVNRCAYINIKKCDGKPKSNIVDLCEHAKTNFEILKEQIRFFNPTIVVGGNIVDNILERTNLEWGDNLNTDFHSVKIFQIKIGNETIPFIDAFHPSSFCVDATEIYLAMKQVEEDIPGYWQRRVGLTCFNKKQE